MNMDWRLNKEEANAVDVHGLGAFLKRLEEAAAPGGESLKGFRFLQDAREMLRFTREIEQELIDSKADGPLYVGFQNAGKLEKEAERYGRLKDSGITVYGFGEDDPPTDWSEGLASWKRLDADHTRLENQWYLISMTPSPVAFVGWEVSDEALFGKGGISAPGKLFAGFVSDDGRAVASMIAHLEGVRLGRDRGGTDDGGAIADLLSESGARRVIALTDEGDRPFLKRALPDVAAYCGSAGAQLLLYDLSAASYLVSPYPDDDDRWKSPQSSSALRRALGRSTLANFVEAASTTGADVKGILPFKVGFAHLAEWCRTQNVDTVVVPAEFTQPSLIQRLQGLALDVLSEEAAGISIIVDDPERGPWLVPAAASSAAVAGDGAN